VTTTTGTLSGTTRAPVVRLTRQLDAPVEDVWSAWTDPERAVRWLGRFESAPAAGRGVPVHMGTGGDDFPATFSIRELEPPHRLQFSWDDTHDPGGVITVTLEPSGDGTRLTLVHELAGADTALDVAVDFGRGWEGLLSALAALLAGGDAAAVKAADTATWDSREPYWREQAAALADGVSA